MTFKTLSVQKENNVLIVSVMNPAEGPIGELRISDEICDLCAQVAWDDEIRVVVLTGAGEKSFAFRPASSETPSKKENDDETGRHSVAESVAGIDLPVIAAIPGDAIGRGLEMVLACDIRVAAERSRFGLPQIEAGLIPGDGGTQRLARLVGRGKALEMILTGGMIGALEAHRIGLVNQVASSEELLPAVMKMAREMASKAPIALRYAKEAIHQGMDLTLEQGLKLEADLYLLLHTTQDRTEGVRAFREKKIPRFEGK
jgi:enoyl-CoA hydratase/carnithine racemase